MPTHLRIEAMFHNHSHSHHHDHDGPCDHDHSHGHGGHQFNTGIEMSHGHFETADTANESDPNTPSGKVCITLSLHHRHPFALICFLFDNRLTLLKTL